MTTRRLGLSIQAAQQGPISGAASTEIRRGAITAVHPNSREFTVFGVSLPVASAALAQLKVGDAVDVLFENQQPVQILYRSARRAGGSTLLPSGAIGVGVVEELFVVQLSSSPFLYEIYYRNENEVVNLGLGERGEIPSTVVGTTVQVKWGEVDNTFVVNFYDQATGDGRPSFLVCRLSRPAGRRAQPGITAQVVQSIHVPEVMVTFRLVSISLWSSFTSPAGSASMFDFALSDQLHVMTVSVATSAVASPPSSCKAWIYDATARLVVWETDTYVAPDSPFAGPVSSAYALMAAIFVEWTAFRKVLCWQVSLRTVALSSPSAFLDIGLSTMYVGGPAGVEFSDSGIGTTSTPGPPEVGITGIHTGIISQVSQREIYYFLGALIANLSVIGENFLLRQLRWNGGSWVMRTLATRTSSFILGDEVNYPGFGRFLSIMPSRDGSAKAYVPRSSSEGNPTGVFGVNGHFPVLAEVPSEVSTPSLNIDQPFIKKNRLLDLTSFGEVGGIPLRLWADTFQSGATFPWFPPPLQLNAYQPRYALET